MIGSLGSSWLREASMARLSVKLKGKKGELVSPLSSIHIEHHKLLYSGMAGAEVAFIERWVNGTISGRS